MVFSSKIGAVDYAVIIAGKVVVHVIKHTVAAVNKVGGKTALMQQLAYASQTVAIGPVYHCLTRDGRDGYR